jgi:hypothetical protein
LDVADILVDRLVPHDAEHVAKAVVAQFLKEPDVAAQFDEVILHERLQVGRAVVLRQGVLRLLGKTKRPRQLGGRSNANAF